MSYQDRDTFGMYAKKDHKGPGPELMGADTLIGDHVHNLQNEHLGEIKEFMLDMRTGQVAYAVMSSGGVFTIGQKLFAVPFKAHPGAKDVHGSVDLADGSQRMGGAYCRPPLVHRLFSPRSILRIEPWPTLRSKLSP